MYPRPRANATNKLVRSAHYGRILREYREWLLRDGYVQVRKFYREVVAGLVPNYSEQAFYYFVKRFKTENGLIPANTIAQTPAALPSAEIKGISGVILSNQQATSTLIQSALNISAQRAKELLENPQLLSTKDALDLGIKAMKAQDSRIHAIGKIREDTREQAKFERAFDNAAL